VTRREIVLADPLERARLREPDDVGRVARGELLGVGGLEALEPLERDAEDVLAAEVTRGRKAVGIVVDVQPHDGDDLEQVLRGRERLRRLGAGAAARERGADAGLRREPRAPRAQSRAVCRAASRFNIFSVAITAAASWSESTPIVLNGCARAGLPADQV
jgi:hypothetical protein